MRRRSLTLVTVLALGLTALAGTAPAAAEDPPGSAYVAIGDSVAAGTGNQPYVDPGCLRSAKSYPMLLGAQLGGVDSSACSGASTIAVASTQLGDLGPATQLVTITAGMNDFDWTGALIACVGDSASLACQQQLGAASAAIAQLAPSIGGLVLAVRAEAPAAQIVVTGYPMLFGDVTGSCSIGAYAGAPVQVSAAHAFMLNGLLQLVNSQISTGVQGYITATGDPGVLFVDVTAAFDGHGLCDTGDRWISGLVSGPTMFARSLHPNAAGQQAYAALIASALAG